MPVRVNSTPLGVPSVPLVTTIAAVSAGARRPPGNADRSPPVVPVTKVGRSRSSRVRISGAVKAGLTGRIARPSSQQFRVVFAGEGPGAFCWGGEQRWRGDDGYRDDKGIGRLNVLDLQIQIRRLPKPVVAMVAGCAIGGGHVLHIVCDLTIAADNARFGQT